MSKKKWVDSSAYSRDDKERIPTTWTLNTGQLRIVVTCGHIHYRGIWIMHCHHVGIDTLRLSSETKEHAQESAIELVKQRLSMMMDSLQETTGELA